MRRDEGKSNLNHILAKMKTVISGGSGLIGRALASDLRSAGHDVRILSRRPDKVKGLAPGVGVEGWDARSAEDLVPLVAGADALVHLAGANIGDGRWTAARKQLIRDSRVTSSEAVAEALRTPGGPSVLIQASAVGYYGSRGDEKVTEEAAPSDDFLGRTCREWEAASESVESRGVRRAIARTGVVLARDGGALPRMVLPFKLFAGGPAGSGRQWLPWIHLRDEVAALRFLVENDAASGPFNLTAPEPVTNRQLSKALGRVLGRPSFMPAPGFALRLALGEMSALVLEGQRALPSRLEELDFSFQFSDIEAALQDLYG